MASLKESLAGPGYVILNAIRVINIIVFLDIIAASVVMLVKIDLLTAFFFFEAVSHVATAGVSIFLIISELPFLRGYFDRNWPLLGQNSGFITLAIAMLILGVGVLGDLNTNATSQESLGMAFWRIVLSAGILAMIMSVINVIAVSRTSGFVSATLIVWNTQSFIFADSDLGVSARHVRVYGAVAPQKVMSRNGSQPPTGDKISPLEANFRFLYGPESGYPITTELQCAIAILRKDGIKSVLIFFAPIIIPRAINYYRTLRVALSSRPPPRPLPQDASRALNVLFLTITLFFCLSLPFNPHAPSPSIFTLTNSRLTTSTDIIFSRLARLRPNESLTPSDTLLKSKLTSTLARKVYLRFGPETLTNCAFCSLDNLTTYAIYHLPFNVLLPHLFHMATIGLVTSSTFAGSDASKWRKEFSIMGIAFTLLDIYVVMSYDPMAYASAAVRAGVAVPSSSYYQIGLLRPLLFAIFDGVCALLIWLSATRRFFFTPPSQAEQVDQVVSASLGALSGSTSKLHAVTVARNAVVRDKMLRDRDEAYWRTVVAMNVDNPAMKAGTVVGGGENGEEEGAVPPTSIWEEEEVVRAMSRAMAGQGGVDLARLGMDAAEYVNGVTAGLEGN
ncbi:similar to An04g00630 [Aspergillus luchuensis]|uniref:Similar to An04g00630 n=1 Tax=Aspergillus kawachii TaxID=1069201 RepID=A0A146FJ59_ASPKA|nr:similar to An04g00630 [Aspergillus luchuensis]